MMGENVSQGFINELITSMPDRLQAVADGEGKMIVLYLQFL